MPSSSAPKSWSKVEVIVDDEKNICPNIDKQESAPPLVVLSISLKTITNPHSHANEIVALSGVVDTQGRNVKYTLTYS